METSRYQDCDLGLARIHAGQRALAEGDGRQAGRAAQAFLRAAVAGVDAPVVHAQVVAAEAGDGVHDEQGAAGVDEVGQAGEGLMRAGAGFGMDDAEELGARVLRRARRRSAPG